MSWPYITALLSSYGFIKQLRPITPFLTPYLMQDKNVTAEVLYGEVYPFWTYSYLVCLVPVFVLTDLLRYKPVIVSETVGLLVTCILLIWGNSLVQFQVMQCCFGWSTAAEVAYYSYIYAAVDSKHFQTVTSYVRGSALAGSCVAFTLSQVLVSVLGTSMLPVLNYIGLATTAVGVCLALALRATKKAELNSARAEIELPETESEPSSRPIAAPLLDKSEIADETKRSEQAIPTTLAGRWFQYLRKFLARLRASYSNGFVLRWCLWWSLATCGFFQIGNFIQNLWAEVYANEAGEKIFNGVTEAVSTLLGAILALSVQLVHLNWSLVGELALGLMMLLDAGLLIFMARTTSLVVAYSFYVLYCAVYQVLITIASYNVAAALDKGNHGLVFGCNTFIALLLQTCLTFIVPDKNGLNLDIRTQFVVYGALHGIVALAFLVMAGVVLHRAGWSTLNWANIWLNASARHSEQERT